MENPPKAPGGKINRAANWSRRLAESRYGDLLLFAASFSETTVVPVPIEAVLVPHMAANRGRVWWLATVTLAGCLAGAMLGYAVGLLLFESVGNWLIEAFGWQQDFATFRDRFSQWGFWAVVAIGVVPIPFQVAMLIAGMTGYSFVMFVLAAILARGTRYYGLAALVLVLGPAAARLWRGRSRSTRIAIAAAAVVGVAAFFLLSMA